MKEKEQKKPTLKDLKKELETKTKQLEEYTTTLQQLQADFENNIKRTAREKEEYIKYAKAHLLLKFLLIVDNFERALAQKGDNTHIMEGLEMIYKDTQKLLTEEGVTAIHARETVFDPYKHEIIDYQKSTKKEDTVLEELQKGYMLYEKVLRPSKVRIAKGETNV